MSRRYLPGCGDDPPEDEEEYVVDRPAASWWNRELGSTPVIAVGLALGSLAVVLVIVFATTARPPAEQPNVLVQLPPPAVAPAASVALEPGTECTISNLRTANGALNGFGGQAALVFDYQFPRGPGQPGPRLLIAVVKEPGQPPAAANVSPLWEDSGTVSLAAFGNFSGFPRGTTVYLANQLDAGPDERPKRISNVLRLD